MPSILSSLIETYTISNTTFFYIGLGGVFTYLLVVNHYRYKIINEIRRKYPDPKVVLENYEIAQEIYNNIFFKEFPLITRKSLEFALFKTYAIPSISKILCSTQRFEKHGNNRVEDTDLLISEIVGIYSRVQNGEKKCPFLNKNEIQKQYERSTEAMARLNEIHGKYNIYNDDYLFTLFLFILEPISWINMYEWRKLDEREINAILHVWIRTGEKMNIKDIPDTLDDIKKKTEFYKNSIVSYSPNNLKCAIYTIAVLASTLPEFLQPIGESILARVMPCVLEDQYTKAFSFEPASLILRGFINGVLHLRGYFIRYFCLPREIFHIRTPFQSNNNGAYVPEYDVYGCIYPNGYVISELGKSQVVLRKKD
ncbi:hypothetical protein BDF14DRAFT_1794893 [Spinellus fusiger]|nr:hypothetical protein BDF14DRAFT_1794893 [Spinellus fusiger]